MIQFGRRQFACACGAGALSLFTGCSGGDSAAPTQATPAPAPAPAPLTRLSAGCGLANYGAAAQGGTPWCAVSQSSGRADVDSAFAQESQSLATFWGVQPKLSFIDDCYGANAFAQPTDVYFGLKMIQDLLAKFQFNTATPIWSVLAHEYGHVMQFQLGVMSPTAPRSPAETRSNELIADMFSSFYLSISRSGQDIGGIQASLQSAYDIGDYAFNDPNHHGTPVQRASAFVGGARVALEYLQQQIPRTLAAVYQRFQQELVRVLSGPA